MANGSIARRYARALIALGQETGKTDTFAGDLTTFAGVLDIGEGELRLALSNPGLTTVERKSVLDGVLAKLKLDSDTDNFLRLLVDKNRFAAFEGIARAFSEMADELAGRARATVSTATELTADMQKRCGRRWRRRLGRPFRLTFKWTQASSVGWWLRSVTFPTTQACAHAWKTSRVR